MGVPTATVIMKGPDGISRHASSIGTGPVDAAYKVRYMALAAGSLQSLCINALLLAWPCLRLALLL